MYISDLINQLEEIKYDRGDLLIFNPPDFELGTYIDGAYNLHYYLCLEPASEEAIEEAKAQMR